MFWKLEQLKITLDSLFSLHPKSPYDVKFHWGTFTRIYNLKVIFRRLWSWHMKWNKSGVIESATLNFITNLFFSSNVPLSIYTHIYRQRYVNHGQVHLVRWFSLFRLYVWSGFSHVPFHKNPSTAKSQCN